MEPDQTVRQTGRSLQEGLAAARQRLNAAVAGRLAWMGQASFWGRALLLIVILFVFSYPLLAWIGSTVDDDMTFSLEGRNLKAGQSRAVAVMSALIRREVEDHGWVANNPWFSPSGMLLDDMPSFQSGMIQALARFSFELQDQLGRTRGSSQIDQDLQSASGFMQTAPTLWYWNPANSILPTAPAETQYLNAAKRFEAYNERLANGQAVFDRRADNLIAAIERIAQDIGSSSAAIDRHLEDSSGYIWSNSADDLFYNIKGQMYAYYMVLRELGQDFEPLLKERQLETVWKQMLHSFAEAAELQPWLGIMDGSPGSQFFPSHLSSEGFYLLRARMQLREVGDVLAK
ncbi:MAG: DUF2333 family protein [Alphaproteobacteria bacterium]|nr:DUF2333 family protein [Alphaproteobacteria bacterium]